MYSICHHTIFIYSNVVLVHQTFKRKSAVIGRGGARTKYSEKVVTPDKSNSPLGVIVISPDPQNTGPTLADSSPTTLVIFDAPTQETPTAANSMMMPVDIAPAL